MEKDDYLKSPRFMARRIVVYSLTGAFYGAFYNALMTCIMGFLIGTVAALIAAQSSGTTTLFADFPVRLIGTNIYLGRFELGTTGGLIGFQNGTVAGALTGLLAFGVWGFLAPPSPLLKPDQSIVLSTAKPMGYASELGLGLYLIWSAISGTLNHGFGKALQEGLVVALFIIPCFIVVGHVIGVWYAVNKLKTAQMRVE